MSRRWLFACVSLLPCSILSAAELGVGTTQAETLAQLGAPRSKMKAGEREIYIYPAGRVVFLEGRIESVEWKGPLPVAPTVVAEKPSATVAVPPPTPAAATPVPIASPPTPAPPDSARAQREVWFTDFAAAQKEAEASKRRMLVLFTGTDWCAPCIQFEASVAHAPRFLSVASAAFVLVKLDYLRNTPQPAAKSARLEQLRERYGINSYPSLLVISADGKKSSRVDTIRRRSAEDMVEYFVQAVEEARVAKEKSSFWPW